MPDTALKVLKKSKVLPNSFIVPFLIVSGHQKIAGTFCPPSLAKNLEPLSGNAEPPLSLNT